MDFKKYILEVPNFPRQGINFKDITPILTTPKVYQVAINEMAKIVEQIGANVIVAPEARGFLFAAPVAYLKGLKLVLIRKKGKLPPPIYGVDYDLEYGQDTLEVHQNDLQPLDKVVIIDDLLATGGTIAAIDILIKKNRAQLLGVCTLIDLPNLHEIPLLEEISLHSLVKY